MEERLRSFMQGAGPAPEPTEAEWNAFARRAHHNLAVRRGIALVAAAALVLGAAIAGGAIVRSLSTKALPPAQEGPKPVELRLGEVERTCPETGPAAPKGPLGVVAYVRGHDIRVIDLSSGEDYLLVDGDDEFAPTALSWSSDGRWLTFGDGGDVPDRTGVLVVPAGGSGICAPLGTDVSHPSWTGRGELIAVGENALRVSAVNGEPREIRLRADTLGIGGYVLDPTGERVAMDVHDIFGGHSESIWIADLYPEEQTMPTEVYGLPMDDPSSLAVAAYMPDQNAVYAFKTFGNSASIAFDGGTLLATLLTDPGGTFEVTDMLRYRDFLAICGDRLIVAAGGDRFVTTNKRLVAVEAPDFQAQPIDLDQDRASFWPDCGPDGTVVATSTPDEAEERFGVAERKLVVGQPGGVAFVSPPEGVSYEFPRFDRAGTSILFVERERKPTGPARLGLMAAGGSPPAFGGDPRIVADLGKISMGTYGYYPYDGMFAWYQP